MTSFLVLEVCYVVPFLLFKIVNTLACGAISLYFLKKELWELTQKYLPQKDIKFLVYYGVGSQVLLIAIVKFYFFTG